MPETAVAPSPSKSIPAWLLASFAGDVVILDQLTKWIVQKKIEFHSLIPVTPFFDLTHVRNTGASFGMFQDSNHAFIGLTAIILTVLAFLHRRLAAEGAFTAVGLALLWGGAAGNLIDRLRLDGVVDFLYLHWGPHYWPAFNVADSAITVGVVLLILDSLLSERAAKVGLAAEKS
jgi:signal peptidase II